MLRLAVMVAVSTLLLGSAVAQPTQSPSRIALVIGNSAYEAVTPLPNAAGDAAAIAQQLRNLSFDVVEESDLNREDLDETIRAFTERLRATGPDTISFVYYSGHAAQDDRGINYLIPVDATARTPAAVRREATPLQAMFDDMVAANNPVNVVVIDACRDWYEFSRERRVIGVRGLSDMGAGARRAGNVFIGLATAPGDTAADGGGAHSPYAAALIGVLQTSANQPISLLFEEVSASVYEATDSAQSPEFVNGLARRPRWCLINGPHCGRAIAGLQEDVQINAFLRDLDEERLMVLVSYPQDPRSPGRWFGSARFVNALLGRRQSLASNGIDTPLRLAHFLTALGAENRFDFNTENLNYRADILTRVSPELFPPEIANEYARNPQRIANRLYANLLGNGDESSGDGWNYRGRSHLWLRGRDTYDMVGQWLGIDLLSDPVILERDMQISLRASITLWNRLGLNAHADEDDLLAIACMTSRNRERVSETLPRRVSLLAAAKAALGGDTPNYASPEPFAGCSAAPPIQWR